MGIPNKEAKRRLILVDKIFCNHSLDALVSSVFLAGSVAYGPQKAVTENSDVDIVMVTKKVQPLLKTVMDEFLKNNKNMYAQFENVLKHRFFDGVTTKFEKDNVHVSLHVLTEDALDVIAKCFVADIRLLRKEGKIGTYILTGFEGQKYSYNIRNIPLEEASGFFRTIVPVTFINKDRYYLAIHRDKLLSSPRILYDPKKSLESAIDKVWDIVAKNLVDESYRLYGGIDFNKLSITKALSKFSKMDHDIQAELNEKQQLYVEKYISFNSL